MRIAQVAPLHESVPPKAYGGTERIVSYLTEELVARGHDVTLYASGDSETRARLRAPCRQALRLDPTCHDALAYHHIQLEMLMREQEQYDIVHFHTDHLHFGLARRAAFRHVTTLHGRLDMPELVELHREFAEIPVVSISQAQRGPIREARWVATIHHGLPPDLLGFHEQPGKYLAFLGRVSPEKRLDQAIEIATRLGMPLRVAAKVDRADHDYYVHKIAPLLHSPQVEFVGEISEREKEAFLGGAQAMLFPIDWPEPFGLVLIEAMACGTPVVAFRRGSVPEIIDDGETGFLVDTVDQAVAAVKRVPELSRRRCREVFERRFTSARMVDDYLHTFAALIDEPPGVEHVSGGVSRWAKPSPSKISSTSSQPRRERTNEPAF